MTLSVHNLEVGGVATYAASRAGVFAHNASYIDMRPTSLAEYVKDAARREEPRYSPSSDSDFEIVVQQEGYQILRSHDGKVIKVSFSGQYPEVSATVYGNRYLKDLSEITKNGVLAPDHIVGREAIFLIRQDLRNVYELGVLNREKLLWGAIAHLGKYGMASLDRLELVFGNTRGEFVARIALPMYLSASEIQERFDLQKRGILEPDLKRWMDKHDVDGLLGR